MFTISRLMSPMCGSIILMAVPLCGCDDQLLGQPDEPFSSPPASPAVANVAMTAIPQIGSGSLILEGILEVPGISLVTHATISGGISYSIIRMPYRGAYRINVDLALNAILSPEGGETTLWRAAGKFSNQLFLVEEGSVLLEMECPITGSLSPLWLHLSLLVTPCSVYLKGVKLQPVGGFGAGVPLTGD